MRAEDIQELIDKDPFETFRLRLTNGDVHEVTNPRLMVVMKTQIFLALPNDRWTLIPLRHVASLESGQAA